MNFKLCFVFLFIGFIFLNLSCVCADVEDNSTVVGDSFNEFENVDVIYDNFNELRDDISEGPFFMVMLIKLNVHLIRLILL